MASQIVLKKSSVAGRAPVVGDLAFGELALNYADGLLYYKKSDGTTVASIGGDTLATILARGATTSVIPSFTNGINLVSNPTYGGSAIRIQGSDGPDGIYGSIQFVDVAGTSVWGTLYATDNGFSIGVPFSTNSSLTLTNGNLSVNGNVTANNLLVGTASVSKLTDTVSSWAVSGNFAGVLNPNEVFFKPDGTKMFLSVGSTLNQYTLSTPWDITTAGTVTSFTNTWDTGTLGFFISPDGTKLITVGQTAVVNAGLGIVAAEDRAYYLTLGTAWDITTPTLVSSLRFAAADAGLPTAETAPGAVTFNSDGTIMYVLASASDYINQYTLSTAYNVSTATYSKRLSITTLETNALGMAFNAAGTRVYVVGTTAKTIFEYRLTTAWDITTAVYYDSLFVAQAGETSPQGVFINEASNSAFICGPTLDLVTKFSTSATGISLVPSLATGRIDLIGETRVKNANLYVGKNIVADGTLTINSTSIFNAGITTVGIANGNGAVAFNNTTTAISIGTSQTTGAIAIGGTAATGAITVGQSTANQTLNIGIGATVASSTKIINIGSSGVSGSTTNIISGSSVTGALVTHTWNAGTNGMVLNSNGNLGIGGVTPASNPKLSLYGGIRFLSNESAAATYTGIGSIASDTVSISTSGSERVRVDTDGNVGVGTASPTQKLEVGGTIYSNSGGFKFPDGTTQTTASVLSPFLLMGA